MFMLNFYRRVSCSVLVFFPSDLFLHNFDKDKMSEHDRLPLPSLWKQTWSCQSIRSQPLILQIDASLIKAMRIIRRGTRQRKVQPWMPQALPVSYLKQETVGASGWITKWPSSDSLFHFIHQCSIRDKSLDCAFFFLLFEGKFRGGKKLCFS